MHWGKLRELKKKTRADWLALQNVSSIADVAWATVCVRRNMLSSQMDALNRQSNQKRRCTLNPPLTFHPSWNCCSEVSSYLTPLMSSEFRIVLWLSKKDLVFLGYLNVILFPFLHKSCPFPFWLSKWLRWPTLGKPSPFWLFFWDEVPLCKNSGRP